MNSLIEFVSHTLKNEDLITHSTCWKVFIICLAIGLIVLSSLQTFSIQQSVTFTNGGMHYSQIGFRLVQRLLMYPSIGNNIQKLRNMLQSSGYVSKERFNR